MYYKTVSRAFFYSETAKASLNQNRKSVLICAWLDMSNYENLLGCQEKKLTLFFQDGKFNIVFLGGVHNVIYFQCHVSYFCQKYIVEILQNSILLLYIIAGYFNSKCTRSYYRTRNILFIILNIAFSLS